VERQAKAMSRRDRKYKSRGPEFLRDLEEQALLALRENGVRAGLAEDLANSIARKMCQHWGGIIIYFPKGDYILRRERDLRIYAEFTGSNHAELAHRYDTSMQHIYRIIEWMRAEDLAQRQPQLNLEGGKAA
jgi:Mor family transcriptional regulator